MNSCAWTSTILGTLLGVFYLWLVLKPASWRNAAAKFPRSVWPGRILTAVAVLWVSWLLFHMNLGRLSFLKSAVWYLAPICYLLIIFFMDDLLAPRALGGLMLLAANPIFYHVRWHDSNLRLIIVVLGYIIVIKGMLLVLSPFQFRRLVNRFLNTDSQCRRWGGVGLAFSAFLLILGLFVF